MKSSLVLLHSCPDTVRRHILRKTQTSSPLIKGCYTNADPPPSITPTIADCRYKAPLTPRLHGHFILPFLYTKVKHYDFSNIWITHFLLLYYANTSISRSSACCRVFLGHAILILWKPSPHLPNPAPLSSHKPA